MTPQDFEKYKIKLLKVPTGTGSAYQLVESGGFSQSEGARSIPTNIAQSLINQGVSAIDIASLSPQDQQRYAVGSLYEGQGRSKRDITQQSDLDQILGAYRQNDTIEQGRIAEAERIRQFNLNPENTRQTIGPPLARLPGETIEDLLVY